MKILFAGPQLPRSGVLVLFTAENGRLTGLARDADSRSKGQIAKAIKTAGFQGKREQSLDLIAPGGGFERVIVFGLGKAGEMKPLDAEMLGGAIAGMLQNLKTEEAAIAADFDMKGKSEGEVAALLGSGASLRIYSFNRYKSKKPEAKQLSSLAIHTGDVAGAKKAFQAYAAIAEGAHLARDLVNEPPKSSSRGICHARHRA